jgi:hypothetical protein
LALLHDSGVVWENAEFAVYCAGGVADVYARDSAVNEDPESFRPDPRQVFVHCVINLRDRFFVWFGFERFPESRDFWVYFSELLVPHLDHWVRRRSYHKVDAIVLDFGHCLAVADYDFVLGLRHVTVPFYLMWSVSVLLFWWIDG